MIFSENRFTLFRIMLYLLRAPDGRTHFICVTTAAKLI
jgi:hypothetical protein